MDVTWETLRRAPIARVIAWAETQSWGKAMAACPQDPRWHAEGDVWTHVKLVLAELERLAEWPSLSHDDRTVLIFTALFHDVAKPLTSETDSITGFVTSPKHAVKGEAIAREALRELGCEYAVRETIAKLVRFHGRPVFLSERESPLHELVRMSWLSNNRLLYLFALADARGRDTESLSRPEENLHYWKLASEEANCFERPYAFASDHARFTFFRSAEPCLHYVPHDRFSCNVTLLAGLPGGGKSTWIEKHRGELPLVSLDDLRDELEIEPTENQGRVAQLARERCREHLRAGNSFVFNATNLLRETRMRWIDLFADYAARIEIVYLEPKLDVILRRNKQRENAVPERVIRRLAEKLDPPTLLECHALTIVTD